MSYTFSAGIDFRHQISTSKVEPHAGLNFIPKSISQTNFRSLKTVSHVRDTQLHERK